MESDREEQFETLTLNVIPVENAWTLLSNHLIYEVAQPPA